MPVFVYPQGREDLKIRIDEPGERGQQGETGPAGKDGVGVPSGGSSGQILAKSSNADYETHWINPPSGGSGGASSADQVSFDKGDTGLQSSNVQGAIEELNDKIKADIVTEEEWELLPDDQKNNGIYVIVGEDDGGEDTGGGDVTPPTPQYEIGRDWRETSWPYDSVANGSAKANQMAYGNGIFVAALQGSNSVILSKDGINWEVVSTDSYGEQISYANGIFYRSHGMNTEYYYSTDGKKWTELDGGLSRAPIYQDFAYGGGRYVGVAYQVGGSNKAAYSSDGLNWTETQIPTNGWRYVAYGGGKFVAISDNSGSNDGHIAAYSNDGISWESTAFPISDSTLYGLVYGNGTFVALSLSNAAYSTDGVTWKSVSLPSGLWAGIAFGEGKFVIVPDNGSSCAYSEDGVTWTITTIPKGRYQAIAYGNGKFATLSYDSSVAAYSPPNS